VYGFSHRSKNPRKMARFRPPAPAEIASKGFRFLITDRPSDATMDSYLQELKKHGVTDVVRVCEPSYDTASLLAEGIQVWDWFFPDGTYPVDEILTKWFDLLKSRFRENPDACIAVHCIAGLGRAPVLVAVALIELGMPSEDAVELIRNKRRGAINAKQLDYLNNYRPKSRLKMSKNGKNDCCVQ
jgi:protein tyrosine phosphatase type 4A